MKKRLLAFAASCLMLLSLAACGGNKKPESSAPADSSSQSESTDGQASETQQSGETGATQSGATGSQPSGTGATTAKVDMSTTVKFTGTEAPTSSNIDLWNAKFNNVTLKRIVWYTLSQEEKKMLDDFKAKTGVTIKDVVVDYENINNKLVASMASGDIIDIGWIYGAFYPSSIISNMYQPIDNYIKQDYLVNTASAASLAKGGFDLAKLTQYKWNNHYYGFCSYWDVDMLVMYYNKRMFEAAGVTTPLEHVQEGTWNLDAFYQAAFDLTDTDKGVYGYSAGGQNTTTHLNSFVQAFGASVVKYDSNNKPSQNLGDSRISAGLNFIKKMYYGAGKVVDSSATFYNGKAAMAIDGLYMAPKLMNDKTVSSTVKNNWEIAPLPLAANNKNGAYPVDWLKATGIIRGTKNPDAVAAFALFKSKYKGDNLYDEYMTAAQKNRITPYYKNIIYANHSYGTMGQLYNQMVNSITKGGDVSKAISENKSLFQAQIDKVLKG